MPKLERAYSCGERARCCRYRFCQTEKAFSELNSYYHEHVHNIPGFLAGVLSPEESGGNLWDLAAWANAPYLFGHGEVALADGIQGYLLMPNTERHADKIALMCSSDSSKRLQSKNTCGHDKFNGGISYTVWAIHPAIQDGSASTTGKSKVIRSTSNIRRSYHTISPTTATKEPGPGVSLQRCTTEHVQFHYEKSIRLNRSKTQKAVSEIEELSGVKYLVTILDLSQKELPFLIRIQAHAKEHMTDWYGYNPESDILRMYFHFPTGDVTSTLHLHVTLNRDMHPVEEAKSFHLESIIDHLNNHDDVFGLLLAKQTRFGGLITGGPADVVVGWAQDTASDLIVIEKGELELLSEHFHAKTRVYPDSEIRQASSGLPTEHIEDDHENDGTESSLLGIIRSIPQEKMQFGQSMLDKLRAISDELMTLSDDLKTKTRQRQRGLHPFFKLLASILRCEACSCMR